MQSHPCCNSLLVRCCTCPKPYEAFGNSNNKFEAALPGTILCQASPGIKHQNERTVLQSVLASFLLVVLAQNIIIMILHQVSSCL
jgi:hypothetical protein